jgi:glutathione S-transferase
MLKLFYARGTCALASFIALEEAGADYETVRIDFAATEQRSEHYLAINPKGRVPALATERGVLTENPAILAYVAQSFPAAKLAPLDDPFAFAEVQAFNSYLCATVHVAHAHKQRGARWAEDPAAIAEMRRHVPRSMGDAFTLIEHSLFKGPWAMGEAYSIVDPYLFTLTGWLEGDAVDIARFPKVQAHYARMAERPAVRSVLGKIEAAA